MKKRIILIMIAVSMLLGAFPVNASAEAATVVDAWNIVLGDNIGANFYVKVPEGTANAAVKVTVADHAETYELTTPNSKGLYKVSVNAAAAQMTENITLQLVADGTEYTPVSYSIRDYAVCILTGTYSDKVKDLVKHMLNYGAAAQTYFGVKTDVLANDGYVINYEAQYPAEYPELAVEGQLAGVRLYGASLVMDSKVAVRYYFTADNVEGVTFSANGVNYSAVEKNGLFYVEVPGILPQQYSDSIVLTAQKGNEKLEVTYSPLTYMVRMSQKGSGEIKALVNAMYGYHQAAAAYLSSAGVTVKLPNVSGGTITADKEKYQWGDIVTLTATPDKGYALASLVVRKDGQPIAVCERYSFLAEDGIYTVEAEFAPSMFTVVSGNWNLEDQYYGNLTITEQKDGTTVVTNGKNYKEVSVTVKDYTPSKNADGSLKQGDFSMQISFIFDDGKEYRVRLHNTDTDKPNYKLQNMGGDNSLTGWKWQADLTAAQKEKLINGDGVKFHVKLVGANAELWVDGQLMKTVALGEAYNGKTAQIKLCMNGNSGVQNVEIPFTLVKAPETATVAIPAFESGTVTADKAVYKIGDTVVLTVAPDEGYSQKLYINGKPLLLDWKTNTYSFVATETTYNITGSFEPGLHAAAKDANRWDTANQAHGIMNAYYPNNADAWLMEIQDEYQAISVKAKNYLAGADGTGGEGFAVNIGFKLSNGKEYIFRVIRENGKYYHQRFGINGSDWTKKALDSAAIAAICAEGADFKLERTAADTLTLSVNGVVYDTYKMDGVTQEHWVTTAIIGHYGNKGQKVAIPFVLTNTAVSGEIQFKSSELSKYVIVYDNSNSDYQQYANQLKNKISEKYGVSLRVVSDRSSSKASHEILLGDTNRYDHISRVMEYSVTVNQGVFRINVGGSCSAENAITYLCENVFNGREVLLGDGEHYRTSLLTSSRELTNGTTARVMSANVLADAFSDDSYKNANYRAEIFAGMLVSYTPDVIGMQEVDRSWSNVLNTYLSKIEKTHGIKYSRYWATYEGKTNYTSLLYRSDKFKVDNSGVEVFSWWKDMGANYNYHMRNISWAQFSSLENSSKKFIVANTHWSYRTEHADGNTYLTGASKPIATDELRTQCKDETNRFMTSLKNMYPNYPVFLVGDFNTSLPYFTQWGWKPASFNVISEQAKNNGTALSTVPTSAFFDHIFGTGTYTIRCYEYFTDVNQHSKLTDHPFAYVDLAF